MADDVVRVSSGSPWEARVGYSRAVRAGGLVFVSGTTGTGRDGRVEAPGDVGAQAERAFENVRAALEACGAGLEDVVRTTMYVTDMARFDEVAAVHRRLFGEARPAAACVEVSRLADPEMLFEVEVTAVAPRR